MEVGYDAGRLETFLLFLAQSGRPSQFVRFRLLAKLTLPPLMIRFILVQVERRRLIWPWNRQPARWLVHLIGHDGTQKIFVHARSTTNDRAEGGKNDIPARGKRPSEDELQVRPGTDKGVSSSAFSSAAHLAHSAAWVGEAARRRTETLSSQRRH